MTHSPPQPRPLSKKWFAVPIAMFALCPTVFLLSFVWLMHAGEQDQLQRFYLPPGSEVQIDEPGLYTIYQEYPVASPIGARVAGIRYTVTNPDGHPVAVTLAGGRGYDAAGRRGEPEAVFTAGAPGRYRIDGAVPGGATTIIAVGDEAPSAFVPVLIILSSSIVSTVLLLGSMGITAWLLIVYFKRKRAAEAAATQQVQP